MTDRQISTVGDRYQLYVGARDRLTGRHSFEAGETDVARLSHRQRLALCLRHYSNQLHDQGSFMAADLIRHAAKELEDDWLSVVWGCARLLTGRLGCAPHRHSIIGPARFGERPPESRRLGPSGRTPCEPDIAMFSRLHLPYL